MDEISPWLDKVVDLGLIETTGSLSLFSTWVAPMLEVVAVDSKPTVEPLLLPGDWDEFFFLCLFEGLALLDWFWFWFWLRFDKWWQEWEEEEVGMGPSTIGQDLIESLFSLLNPRVWLYKTELLPYEDCDLIECVCLNLLANVELIELASLKKRRTSAQSNLSSG